MLDLGFRKEKNTRYPTFDVCFFSHQGEILYVRQVGWVFGIWGRVYFVQSWTSSVVMFGMICCWITDLIRKKSNIFIRCTYRQAVVLKTVWRRDGLIKPPGWSVRLVLTFVSNWICLCPADGKKWEETSCYRGCVILRPGKYLFAYLCCSVSSKGRMSSILSICCIAIS